jgi:hypothetical protein
MQSQLLHSRGAARVGPRGRPQQQRLTCKQPITRLRPTPRCAAAHTLEATLPADIKSVLFSEEVLQQKVAELGRCSWTTWLVIQAATLQLEAEPVGVSAAL